MGHQMDRPLNDRTRRLISLVGNSALQSQIVGLFKEDGALYGPPTDEVIERVRFAVIKLAMQGEKMFDVATQLFRIDTRDLLVSAEFANDLHAHEKWCETMLEVEDV
jgi:hypothetical protein